MKREVATKTPVHLCVAGVLVFHTHFIVVTLRLVYEGGSNLEHITKPSRAYDLQQRHL